MKSNIIFFLGFVLLLSNCTRDLSEDAKPATFPKNGEVYIDGFSAGLEYLPFEDSYLEAFSVDEETAYEGESAMRFDVPNVGDPDGAYAGAIFPDYGGRDLSGFDALTFWAKATKKGNINDIGFGQDFGENKYQVSLPNLELTTNWRQYTIAIPDPSKLTRESGLFWYAEGPEDGEGYTFWIDELKFEKLGTIAQPRPSIFDGEDTPIQTFVGATITIASLEQTLNLGDGQDQTLTVAPSYFTFTSSDPTVATVNEQGVITAISTGEAVITATLNGVEAAGSARVTVTGDFAAAPTPTQDPANVISIFSDAYTNEPVDYYNGYWGGSTTQGQDDINVKDDNIIAYTDLNFVGIQFLVDAPTINASSMTHLHVDIQPREDVEPGDYLVIRVADVGPDNTFGTGDDSAGGITLDNSNLVNGEWYSLDIPFSELAGLTGRSNLAQVVFVSDATISDIYVDNIYFYNDGGAGSTGPAVAAPTPTRNQADVISIFSDAYTDVDRNLNPDWGQATMVSEVDVDGNNTLLYSGLNFQGLELGSPLDVTGMDFLHIDYWTDNSSALNTFLISTGPVETGYALSVPTSGWASVDIPLSDFSPVDLADIIQFKFDGNGSIHLDNIYFYTEGGGATEPAVAAPTPMQNPDDVISVFSDAYTDVDRNLNPNWGQGTMVSEVDVDGNNTLLYSGLDFQGLQLTAPQDVSGMDYLHIDFWTANSSALNAFLISSGPVETAYALSVPTSGWASVDIPLSDFSPVDLADVIQFKFEGNGDIYLDNIYFYAEGGGATEPTVAAPTPMQNPNDVISVFSDVYTDVDRNLNPNWGQGTMVSEVDIDGNNTLLYSGLDFQGLQLGSPQDATGMDYLHIDFWTANSSALNAFLISSGPVETAYALSVPTSGWASVDIPLSDFSPVDLADVIQFKFEGNGDIYLDNIYFYTEGGGATEPTVAAPTPMQNPNDVISVFSDVYTDVDRNLNPNWGQGTMVSEVDIDGNNTLLYSGLDFQGLQLGSPQDATGMDYLHIDFWTANSSALNAFLISSGPVETAYALSVPTSGWASVDIPLSDFSPVDLADVIQLKFEGDGDVYLDNIYFYRDSGGGNAQYCKAEVKHLGIEAEIPSTILLTITNVDAQSMKVIIESADNDPVDLLIVNNLTGPITGSPAISAVDDSVPGQLSVTLTWTDTPPADIEMNVLWSKESFEGNWQLSSMNISVGFDETCP